eukprot:6208573-Pleurochrysis_carterae.AAC.1
MCQPPAQSLIRLVKGYYEVSSYKSSSVSEIPALPRKRRDPTQRVATCVRCCVAAVATRE